MTDAYACAKLMTQHSTVPEHSTLIGYIARHPSGRSGLGYAVLRMAAGVEATWDGQAIRSLPPNWRELVEHQVTGDVEQTGGNVNNSKGYRHELTRI